MAALFSEFQKRPRFSPVLVHTGQHYSQEMSASFFDQLGLPVPAENLGVAGGTQTEQTAEMMRRLEPVLLQRNPHMVLVVGDVNSTLAGTLVSAKLGIPVAHVEAGLRSFDRTMPEEINRVVTDSLSTYLFASEPSGVKNLRAEGVSEEQIYFVGNVMIDTLLRFRDQAATSTILQTLGLLPKSYAVATLHRASNVDDPLLLGSLMEVLTELADRMPLVFPVHPRTRKQLERHNIDCGKVLLSQPLGYLDFLHLNANARLVLTDSGGVQEETTILQVPCLTLRTSTERPATIEQGTNKLVGVEPAAIRHAIDETLNSPVPVERRPDLWDGRASTRVADVLEAKIQ